MKTMLRAAIVIVALAPPTQSSIAAQPREGCVLAAELGVEAVCHGAMASCLTSGGSPLACAVAAACESAAAKEVAKIGAAEGCSYVIDVIEGKLMVIIRGAPEKAETMRKAQRALNSAKGIRWLKRLE